MQILVICLKIIKISELQYASNLTQSSHSNLEMEMIIKYVIRVAYKTDSSFLGKRVLLMHIPLWLKGRLVKMYKYVTLNTVSDMCLS